MTVVMMLLVNRSFSMIYETADNVMKWVGGGVSGAGEFKAGGELQSSVGGAMGNTRQAIGEVSKQALKNGGTSGFDDNKIDAANSGTNTGNNDPSKQKDDHLQQDAPSITASGGGLGGLGGGAGSSGGSSGSAHSDHQQHGASNTARTSTGA
jgi:hypothetical protein